MDVFENSQASSISVVSLREDDQLGIGTNEDKEWAASSKLSLPNESAPSSLAAETPLPFAMMASCLHGGGTKGEHSDTHLRLRLKTFLAKSRHFLMLKLFRRLLVGGIVWLLMMTEELMLGVFISHHTIVSVFIKSFISVILLDNTRGCSFLDP